MKMLSLFIVLAAAPALATGPCDIIADPVLAMRCKAKESVNSPETIQQQKNIDDAAARQRDMRQKSTVPDVGGNK